MQAVDRRSFNEATTARSWNYVSDGGQASVDASFNGATTARSWNYDAYPPAAHADHRLQWGHDRAVVELGGRRPERMSPT